jgi:hypothetical protein
MFVFYIIVEKNIDGNPDSLKLFPETMSTGRTTRYFIFNTISKEVNPW